MTNFEMPAEAVCIWLSIAKRGRKEAFYLAPDICCAASIVAKRA
jgi:hypothetical protein